MRADEAHQQELECRQREDDLLADHRELLHEFRQECRALYERYFKRSSQKETTI